MPPKKRARHSIHVTKAAAPPASFDATDSASASVSAEPTAATTNRPPAGDHMDVDDDDDDDGGDGPGEFDVLNNSWTCDQESALFKAVIRWKPAGLHKHFRMIAISEYLRTLGYDPDLCPHMRIPAIWSKLRTFYDLDLVDDRENAVLEYDDDDLDPASVGEFFLPAGQFLDRILERVAADSDDDDDDEEEEEGDDVDEDVTESLGTRSSQGAISISDHPSPPPPPKRRRTARTARSARHGDDTEDATDTASPAPVSKRGRRASFARGGRRSAARGRLAARATRGESTEEERDSEATAPDEDAMQSSGEDSEGVSPAGATRAVRTRTRSGAVTRARGRGRRARGRNA